MCIHIAWTHVLGGSHAVVDRRSSERASAIFWTAGNKNKLLEQPTADDVVSCVGGAAVKVAATVQVAGGGRCESGGAAVKVAATVQVAGDAATVQVAGDAATAFRGLSRRGSAPPVW